MSKSSDFANSRLLLAAGFGAITLLVGGMGAWSVGAKINGAVVSRGVVKVESERQVIQHPDGGVVGEILAHNGDQVHAGDVLLRLDGTFLRSELAIVQAQLLEIAVRKARLAAERDDLTKVDFTVLPDFPMLDPEQVAQQREGQSNLFAARQATMAKKINQLREQQQQIEKQIEGVEAQRVSLMEQLDLVSQELKDKQSLYERKLMEASRVLATQREHAKLTGEIGRLNSVIAEARVRISSLEIEVVGLSEDRREAAITQLRDLQYNEISLVERETTLREKLARLDVRAPVDGVVFGSQVFALQSVIQPAQPMMFLVPSDQPLYVSVRVDPTSIDQVYSGQQVSLQFSTFNRRTTPAIPAEVLRVSPDVQTDEANRETYYEATVEPDPEALAALPEVKLMPGMPVEAFLKTDARTPLSYLTQPLTIYFNRAFRGE
ncbi:HlyD family type I secretion periplasmic adaptor subunit [Thioclava sp. F36-6]|uniref:HlyD family type I secretion periplasmic adaptor subunit n=1 Tax=Thioclava sp. F36-6 TaxID=1915316 RepID=UPI00099741FC|nr:HlyD family type I secretion periplasmic adaptor subunit [Thioclava sp. F36-6]OOY30461.1 RTX toxin [Thioclava sp. F36-6]